MKKKNGKKEKNWECGENVANLVARSKQTITFNSCCKNAIFKNTSNII
jgi:hypothetical protein